MFGAPIWEPYVCVLDCIYIVHLSLSHVLLLDIVIAREAECISKNSTNFYPMFWVSKLS